MEDHRTENGQLTDQKFELIPFQSLHCHLREHESRGRESPSRTLNNSDLQLDAQVVMQSRTTREVKHTQIDAGGESRTVLRKTPHGAERLDRRDEVINEALAEEVRRGEQRKKRSNEATAAVPEAEHAAPGLRENPIEPDPNPNPKRRLLMKSASSTASGSDQQREKRPAPDGEFRMQTEDMSETGNR